MNQMLGIYVIFKETAKLFQNFYTLYTDSSIWEFKFLHILYNTWYYQPIFSCLIAVYWHHVVVLICISLLINDIEYIFMYSFAIYISSFVKHLFNIFSHKKWLLWLWLWSWCSENSYISRYKFFYCLYDGQIFLLCEVYFNSVSDMFWRTVINLMKLSLVNHVFYIVSKKSLYNLSLESFSPNISSKN